MRCQSRKRYFRPSPKPMGYDQATRARAVRLYLEGNSFRAIGRLLSVHYVSVINWVNAVHAALPEQVADTTNTEIEETDELFTYVGKKQTSLHSRVSSQRHTLDWRSAGVRE